MMYNTLDKARTPLMVVTAFAFQILIRGMEMTRGDFERHVYEAYGVNADYPFEDDLVSGVFRHSDNGKWFAISMNVPGCKLGLSDKDKLDIVNLKCPPDIVESLAGVEEGIFRAYHMNKMHWLTVALDGSCDDGMVRWLLNISYTLTSSSARSKNKKTG